MRLIKSAANDIPSHATGLHVFAIKETSDGAQAFIGWYLPNGNFNYSQVPYEPQDAKDISKPVEQQHKSRNGNIEYGTCDMCSHCKPCLFLRLGTSCRKWWADHLSPVV